MLKNLVVKLKKKLKEELKMLVLETRVNEKSIDIIRVVDKKLIKSGEYEYFVECHRFTRKPSLIKFSIFHEMENGTEELSLRIYKRLYEKIKEYKEKMEKEDSLK